MYRTALQQDENTISYFDKYGNKHIRRGGNLSWRINNPGLVKSHSHYANGSIGSCQTFKKRDFCMISCQEKANLIHNAKRKKAKVCAIALTVFYSLLFPFFAYVALFSAMVFDNPHTSILKGLLIIFITSLIPLSLPVSIDLMWSSYLCEEYNKTLLFWSVPWLTMIFVLVLNSMIQFS